MFFIEWSDITVGVTFIEHVLHGSKVLMYYSLPCIRHAAQLGVCMGRAVSESSQDHPDQAGFSLRTGSHMF